MIWGIFFSILLLLSLTILFTPIRLHFVFSPLLIEAKWLGVSLYFQHADAGQQLQLKVFSFTVTLWPKPSKKPTIKKKKNKPAPKNKKHRKKKIRTIYRILTDPAIRKILREIITLSERILSSLKLSYLYWDFSLEDYSLQGVLHGFTYALPYSESFQIESNFFGRNKFDLLIASSPAKIFFGMLIFIFHFPYLRVGKIYRNWSKPGR